ncbi:MAG: hypothetical protein ACEPOZ_20840 [Marinifilaceae bacterium]
MKIALKGITLMLLGIFCSLQVIACTTAVISGKYTRDGRPMLWKHRDSESYQNKMRLFTDGKYTYVGLINSDDADGKQVWGGNNDTGFAIMNSASFNLREDKNATFKDQEGIIMKKSLQTCRTLEDFEQLLKNLKKPMGLEANFGVIDAQGGAAYYETSDTGFVKFDANDKKFAPNGYIIRANYSNTGRVNEGYGFIRFMNAEKLFFDAAGTNQLTPDFLLRHMCRSLSNELTKTDVMDFKNFHEYQDNFYVVKDCINRYISTSSFVIQGVKEKEDPRLTTMWTLLGFPLSSVTVPTWAIKKAGMPEVMIGKKDSNSELCEKTLALKEKFFPVIRGAGEDYMNTTAAYNADHTGIIQKLEPVEKQVLNVTHKHLNNWRKKGIRPEEVKTYYKELDKMVRTNYKELFNL